MKHCSLVPIFTLLGKKWSLHLLTTLYSQEQFSFGDLQREFPYTTAKVLSQRLKEFELFGLLEKTPNGHYKASKSSLDIQNLMQKFKQVFCEEV